MPASAQASSPATVSSFASLLAGLTSPKPQADSYWNDSALADDVTTISYEQALRAHARYRPTPVPLDAKSSASRSTSVPIDEQALPPRKPPVAEHTPQRPVVFCAPPPTLEEGRKSASVTIRLSEAECVLLHKRATEAGLTVSAYLRSCIFEVETLRGQVKDALSQFRLAPAREPKPVQARQPQHIPDEPLPLRTVLSGWLSRLLARLHRGQRLANA